MPVSAWSHRGSAASTASSTSVSVSPTSQLDVGDLIVVRCVSDDPSGAQIVFHGTSGTTAGQQGVRDSKGNTWTKIGEGWGSPNTTTTAESVVASLWFSVLTTAIGTGDTITLTMASAVACKSIGVEDFTLINAGATVAVAGFVNSPGTTNTNAATLSGLASAEYLWLGVLAQEAGASDGFTSNDPDYAGNTSIGTASGGAASNVNTRFGYRVFTGTSDTYGPSPSAARDNTVMLAALSFAGGGPAWHDRHRLGRHRSGRHGFGNILNFRQRLGRDGPGGVGRLRLLWRRGRDPLERHHGGEHRHRPWGARSLGQRLGRGGRLGHGRGAGHGSVGLWLGCRRRGRRRLRGDGSLEDGRRGRGRDRRLGCASRPGSRRLGHGRHPCLGQRDRRPRSGGLRCRL